MARGYVEAALPYFPGRPRRLPRLGASKPKVDASHAARIERFLRESFRGTPGAGFKSAVVGLSGGLDSVTAALLCRRALGRDAVTAVVVDLGLPGHEEQTRKARRVARKVGVRCRVVDGSGILAALRRGNRRRGPFSEINNITRAIHALVFQVADEDLSGVISTVDRSEALLGRHMEHFYGHVAPLAGLYKTEVLALAVRIGVPDEVTAAPPGCVEAWLDEEVFGVPYSLLDPLLRMLVEESLPADEVARLCGGDVEWVRRVEARLAQRAWRMETRTLGPS